MRKKYDITDFIERVEEDSMIEDREWNEWISQILLMEPEEEVKEIVSRQSDRTKVSHV